MNLNLTKEQLLQPETAVTITAEIPQIIQGARGKEACNLADLLEKQLHLEERSAKGEVMAPIEEEYKEIAMVLRFVGLSFIYNDQRILELFEKYFVGALRTPDLDVQERLRHKLLDFPITTRDSFKEKIRKALHANQERLTEHYLALDDKEAEGTVSNWLRDYIQNVGGGLVDKLQMVQYLTDGANVKKLSPEEREYVRRLITFYEVTKISSETPQGVEDFIAAYDPDRGKHYFINSDGLAEEVLISEAHLTKTITKKPPLVKPSAGGIRALYKNAPITVLKQQNYPTAVFVKNLYEALFSTPLVADREAISLAILTQLAENGALDILLAGQPFTSVFSKYLKDKNKLKEARDFVLTPKTPYFLSQFLQFILVDQLRLGDDRATQLVVRLGNLMKKAGKPEYFDMAYYDMSEKRFKWKL